VHGYSNDIYQADLGAQKDGKKFRIRHSLPKEGAVLALDAMVISKSAPRPDLAVKFINFMLEGQNSADLTMALGVGAFFNLFVVLGAVCAIMGFVRMTSPR